MVGYGGVCFLTFVAKTNEKEYALPTIRKEQSHDLSHGFFSMNKLALVS